jgi:hypothetical protein
VPRIDRIRSFRRRTFISFHSVRRAGLFRLLDHVRAVPHVATILQGMHEDRFDGGFTVRSGGSVRVLGNGGEGARVPLSTAIQHGGVGRLAF